MLPLRECGALVRVSSLQDWREIGRELPAAPPLACDEGPAAPWFEVLLNGRDVLLLAAGVPGMLSPPAGMGLPTACVDSLDGTRDPPLPARFIACPPTMLADTDPGTGDGVADCRPPTRRICARTWDSWRSYSQAACCRRNDWLTSNCSDNERQSISFPLD